MTSMHIQAVVFDWAGTVIDFGSQAPMSAFVELFKRHGLSITIAEARVPMGLPKWHHIQALGQQHRIAALWAQVHGRPFSDSDVDALYEEFTPMNAASVVHHAKLIAGVLDTLAWLRARGVRIGSTTGYNRAIMDVVMPLAAAQGFTPENVVCSDDLVELRPSPMGMRHTMELLGVTEPRHVVKVDDTVPGLLEGRNAGCWTVALLASGNALGMSEPEWQATGESARAALRAQAQESLSGGQPDFFIDTVADLPGVIEQIEAHLGSTSSDATRIRSTCLLKS